jgi:hypothetical protein
LQGGVPNTDPYVSFYDDIQGWEEDDTLVSLLANKTSLKYLNLDGMQEPSRRRDKQLRRSLNKQKPGPPRSTYARSGRRRTECGAEEESFLEFEPEYNEDESYGKK